MKKSLYIYLFYCLLRFSDTVSATHNNSDDHKDEKLYLIEVFDKDITKKIYKESTDPSKRTEQGFVLVVSSKMTWGNFKKAILEETVMEIEDRFCIAVYPRRLSVTPVKVTKNVSPNEYEHTFYNILENKGKRVLSNEPALFYENNFDNLKKTLAYKIAKNGFSQIIRLEKSNKENQSVLAWKGGNRFELMDIDDYHAYLNDPNPISLPESSPEPNENSIHENETHLETPPPLEATPLEISSEDDIPQLIQPPPVDESSFDLAPESILVVPVLAGSIWVGHHQFFSEKKTKKPKKKENIEDEADPNDIIIVY